MTRKRKGSDTRLDEHYDSVLGDISRVIDAARRSAARSVNSIMTAAYWLVGRRIVEYEQGGKARAEYGKALLGGLSVDLSNRYGRGFGVVNLSQMKKFYLLWPTGRIFQTVSEELPSEESSRQRGLIFQTASELLCAQKDEAVARYALEGLPNKVMASEYRTALPDEKELAAEIERTQALLQDRERLALTSPKAVRVKKGRKGNGIRRTMNRETILLR
ncbi:MAG: DUF1016 N-terminal domain-containing protein [Thermodesulfobacteriota bacterium]